ncbi:BolA family protein [Gimibacter soli]
MGEVSDAIMEKLSAALSPKVIDVINQSEMHKGHSGYSDGESHFAVKIVSDIFEGKSRLARQRLVMDALKAELAGPLHALSIDAKTPAEAG